MTLQRRRELVTLTKRELIDWVIQAERAQQAAAQALAELRNKIDPNDDPHAGETVDCGGWEDR